MSNWILGVVFLTVIFQILSFFMEGEQAIVTAQLTSAVTKTDLTINVNSTDGFLDSDFIVIGQEEIFYTSKTSTTFVVGTLDNRGFNKTDIEEHRSGRRVFNDGTALINRFVGFNILQTFTNDGVIIGVFKTATHMPDIARSLAQMLIWDYAFLEGNLIWFKYTVLYAISAAVIMKMVTTVLNRN